MRGSTRQQLRAAVLRDLSWLFNATRPEPDADVGAARRKSRCGARRPLARALGAELRHAGVSRAVTLSSMNTGNIEAASTRRSRLRTSHRPQVAAVEVKLTGSDGSRTRLQLVIRGQMWSQPVPLELLLSADVDMETGNTVVREIRA